MRYMKMKRVIALVLLVTVVGIAGFGRSDNPPSAEEEEFAGTTTDLLHNELVSALFTEFNETTPENAEQGKQAISLIFNNANRDMRLIGIFPPLQGGLNDLPSDSFERKAIAAALQGKESKSVERVGDRWYYRKSFPLSNTFHTSCAICHTNFTTQFFTQTHNDGQWVGALALRVPIKED
ncbi:MAG TPA: hypothetical protein VFV34_09250 [Blastocatellia bacterium]|nr:hypothetical protein [Blastocatellia bacterium]